MINRIAGMFGGLGSDFSGITPPFFRDEPPDQPIPLRVRVIEERGVKYYTRVWTEGEGSNCRICPRAVCAASLSRVEGTCDFCMTRVAPDDDE
jgi:hypothetical protein